ncbi:MAG: selenium metabolism-associated LysR family transcriptional regulator [Thermodesulfobacteriota bacterium]|nr:selenium metabolism-associated LysR family transcriptional regulator [Thermodesulfobacteriota bacterium]
MDVHQLRIFVAVYQNKSFSKASLKLSISQPTISEHIKNLENELGFLLFDRLGRTIEPTQAAEIILPGALQVIDGLEKIKDSLKISGREVSGHLVIGASTIPGTYMLPVLASEFKKKYPDISFEIIIGDTGKIVEMVESHQLLLGVVGAKMNSKKLQYEPFCQDELVYGVSPHLVSGEEGGIDEIHRIPFLMREKGSGTRRNMELFFGKLKIDIGKMNVVAVLGSTASIKEAMKAGLGGSVLSRKAIEEELVAGSLVEMKLDGLRMERSFYLTKLKKRSLPAYYNVFVDYIAG